MFADEAMDIILPELKPFFEAAGYKQRGKDAFIRSYEGGWDSFTFWMKDFYPSQYCSYRVNKRLECVEHIIGMLAEKYDMRMKISKANWTLYFSAVTLSGSRLETDLPRMTKMEDALFTAELIKEFMTNTGFPFLLKMQDVRAFDKIINVEDDWETDFMKPFGMGGAFVFKKLIIARLSGNPRYEEMMSHYHTVYENEIRESPEEEGEFVDGKHVLQYLEEVLKSVTPLF